MELRQYSVKGKDLPGAVQVTPEGLKEVIAKREFIELRNEGLNILDPVIHTQTNNFDNTYENPSHWCQKSRIEIKDTTKNLPKKSLVSTSKLYKPFNNSGKTPSLTTDHRSEICQENLKSTIQSAISDIEVNLNINSEKIHELNCPDDPQIPELAPLIFSSADINNLYDHGINNEEIISSIAESIEHKKEPTNEFCNEDNKLNTETGSLKRRNPREMYTDSSFYNPKHHPSVAEQVEMAYRLSASLYDDGNKKSTGQEMFLKRAKKSGHWIYSDGVEEVNDCVKVQDIPLIHQNRVLNLKLVMNPDGKLYDWTNIQEGDLPPSNPLTPEIALTVVKNLEGCQGKGGELFAKRRKRAEKWVIDDTSIGKTGHPGEVAQFFLQSSNKAKVIEKNASQLQKEIKGQCELESSQQTKKAQEFFLEEQKHKQEKGFEIRKIQQMSKHELPAENDSSNLLSNNFTKMNEWSVHNSQGINVWASSIPESWSTFTTKNINNNISISEHGITKKNVTDDLERIKKKEYDRWFQEQEKIQKGLEYDCFVEYIEKKGVNTSEDKKIDNINKNGVNLMLFQIPEKNIEMSIINEKIYNDEIQEYIGKKEQIIKEVDLQHETSMQGHTILKGRKEQKCNKQTSKLESLQQTSTIVKHVNENIIINSIDRVTLPNVNEERCMQPLQNLDVNYEKYSVKNLVDRFSKSTPSLLPLQYLPQQYLTSNENPPLNYLQQQEGQKKINEFTAKKPMNNIQIRNKCAEKDFYKLNKSHNAVEEFFIMNVSDIEEHVSSKMSDPSYLLADKDIPNEYFGYHRLVQGDESINLLSLEKSKWDNHNTIARGWKSASSNYVPVTFRKKYNVENQKL